MKIRRLLGAALVFLAGAIVVSGKEETKAKTGSETLSVDFPDADIRQVLLNVAELFQLQVKIPDKLAGTTSIRLRDVTWRQIYFSVLSPVGYDFMEGEKFVEVMTKEEVARLPPVTRSVEVFFQKPEEFATFLAKGIPGVISAKATEDGVQFTCHPRLVHLVLDEIARMDDPHERLERFPRKVYFQTFVPALSFEIEGDPKRIDTEVIVFRWVSCEAAKAYLEKIHPEIKMAALLSSNQLVVSGPRGTLQEIRVLAEFLDDKRWYERPKKKPEAAPPPSSPSGQK
jgi:type II secretory pathway component GspD/PulD (secretin)